jgi:hypothetical protein
VVESVDIAVRGAARRRNARNIEVESMTVTGEA